MGECAGRSRGPGAIGDMCRATCQASRIWTTTDRGTTTRTTGQCGIPRSSKLGGRRTIRALGVDRTMGMDVGGRCAVGMGAVPLWALGICARPVGMVSGPCDRARGVRARARGVRWRRRVGRIGGVRAGGWRRVVPAGPGRGVPAGVPGERRLRPPREHHQRYEHHGTSTCQRDECDVSQSRRAERVHGGSTAVVHLSGARGARVGSTATRPDPLGEDRRRRAGRHSDA